MLDSNQHEAGFICCSAFELIPIRINSCRVRYTPYDTVRVGNSLRVSVRRLAGQAMPQSAVNSHLWFSGMGPAVCAR